MTGPSMFGGALRKRRVILERARFKVRVTVRIMVRVRVRVFGLGFVIVL